MCFLVTHLFWDSDQMYTNTLELEDSIFFQDAESRCLWTIFWFPVPLNSALAPPSTCQWSCWQLVFMPRYVIYLVQETWPHLEQFSFPIHFLDFRSPMPILVSPLQPSNSMLIDKDGSQAPFSLCRPLASHSLLQPQTPSPALIILPERRKSVLS